MPELSVIMGVYNCPAKEMLVRAIDSILNQTYGDFEFIICDDGSTNDTLEWLKEKASEDRRIYIIESETNKGLANALNLCLEKASGSYIARQDIDDYSAPTRFETQLKFLQEHTNIAFVGTACFVYDNNGLYGEWHRPEFPSRQDFLFNSPFIHGTVMFRREVFDRCGGYELIGRCRKYEDYAFFMHAYAEGFQGANINQLLYTFFSQEKKNMVSTRMRLDEYSVRKKGFRELGIGIKRIPYIYKPIILIAVPNKLLNSLKDNKKNRLMHKKSLSLRIYKVVVNRNTFIKTNYERYVNGNRARHKRFPILSWMYLLKLNIEYGLSKPKHKADRKSKAVQNSSTEPAVNNSYVTETVEKLCRSDIVSFDLFDTLVFRPFSVPSDIFLCVGERLNYPDFKTIRTEAEKTVREVKGAGLSINDIYEFIEDQTGIDAKLGCAAEMEVESELSMPNPVMKQIWDAVKARGKRIIVSTDMYLPKSFICSLLEKNGFTGAEQVFVSCECGMGKHEGTLYEYIKNIMGTDSISHIGDNRISDVRNAKKHGFKTVEYRNVNLYGNKFRPKDMPSAAGSAYSGIVNARLYRGDMDYSPAYEYGYRYGGILILGLCEHLHRLARKMNAAGVLFLCEGGYIVKKIYENIYPEDKAKYIYWSDRAALKISAEKDSEAFIRYFVLEKADKGLSVYDVMDTMGIADWRYPFELNEELTSGNAPDIEKYLKQNMKKITSGYKNMRNAAVKYIADELGSQRYLCVEFASEGRAGILIEKFIAGSCELSCDIESMNFVECDIYSRLLFGSPEPMFLEYRLTDPDKKGSSYEHVFEDSVRNELYIREIQKGETEFIKEYLKKFGNYEVIRNISLNASQKPFEYAIAHDRHYIDMVFADCVFDEDKNTKKKAR
ncbi:MAG: HAD-IA family hydrolase [Lachnospiraceae bacterium]|nr:HAD-IA family hydrolase [Lachnospiraceae bacterium]